MNALPIDILVAIKEYLEFISFEKTVKSFNDECAEKGVDVHTSPILKNPDEVKARLNETFKNGKSLEFFEIWNTLVPENNRAHDSETLELEFYLQIHFSVYPMRNNIMGEEQEVAMQKFREYIDANGAALSHNPEFLPYFALPFVKSLNTHSNYAHLFQPRWVVELFQRLLGYVETSGAFSQRPRILSLSNNYGGGPGGGGAGGGGDSLPPPMRGDHLEDLNERFNQMQKDYHNLITITADLVQALETTIKGQPITLSELQRICSRNFSKQIMQSLETITTESVVQSLRQSMIAGNSFISQNNNGSQLMLNSNAAKVITDYQKLKSDLVNVDTDEKTIALLLQALRWRLTKPGYRVRDANLEHFINSDILACNENADVGYRKKIMKLMTSSNSIIQEYMARLFNAIASLCKGRTYLAGNPELMTTLMDSLKRDRSDNLTRENILGCLQKLSLRRSLQTTMIAKGMIPWLVETLENTDILSDYTTEYSNALLMNLCLRSSGKQKCASFSKRILNVLVNLLDHDNFEIKSYVNGTMYSILSLENIRKDAHEMNLNDILQKHLDIPHPENPMNRQLQFIIKQLNHPDPDEDFDSDDNADEDEEEDQESMEIDLDKNEPLLELSGLAGEKLLAKYSVNKSHRILDSVANDDILTRPTTPSSRFREFDGSRPSSRVKDSSNFCGNITNRNLLKVQKQNGDMPSISTEYKEAFSSRPRLTRTAEGRRPDMTSRSSTSLSINSDTHISINEMPRPIFSDRMPSCRSVNSINSLSTSKKEEI